MRKAESLQGQVESLMVQVASLNKEKNIAEEQVVREREIARQERKRANLANKETCKARKNV